MFRSVVALVVAGALAASANAQSPMLKLAKVEKNELVMNETYFVNVQETVKVAEKTSDGKVVFKDVAVTKVIPTQVKKAIPLTGVKATTADGKPIPNDKLAALLKDETVVVVLYGPSPDGDKFRKALKDDTIVITIDHQATMPAVPGGPGGPVPVVVPGKIGPAPGPGGIPGPVPVPVPKGLPPVTLPAKPI